MRIQIFLQRFSPILYGGARRSISDADSHEIITIFSTFHALIRQWEIQTYTRVFFFKVAYTRYDVTLFLEQMDYIIP
jgi:hypothetical protein